MRYGPLPDTGKIEMGDFNLLFGKNEDGKTLTIDALVRFLLGKNVKDFEKINRVDENPEGYAILEEDGGNEIKLPEKGNLTDFADLTPSECRNIFIIRDSDLSISSESDFYTSITDRLIGLRTHELSKIRDKLLDLGKLTPGFTIRDKKGEKLKTNIDRANKLIQDIEPILGQMEEEGFENLENDYVYHLECITQIRSQIDRLEDARKREKYEKGKEALNAIRIAQDSHEDLKIYDETKEQEWRDSERKIELFQIDLTALNNDLSALEEDFVRLDKELNEKDIEFQILRDKKTQIDDEIKPNLKNLQEKQVEVVLQEEKDGFITKTLIVSLIFLGISLFGVIIDRSISLFYISGGISLISTFISGYYKFQIIQSRARLEAMFERIKLNASKFNFIIESIEDLFRNIQHFDDSYNRSNAELQEITRKNSIKSDEINKIINTKIPEIKFKIESEENKIIKIKIDYGEETLLNFSDKIMQKRDTERIISVQNAILKNIFVEKHKILEENIFFWEKEIVSLEKYSDKAANIKYNEELASELNVSKQEYKNKIGEIKDKISHFESNMNDVEREGTNILKNGPLFCKTSSDLSNIKMKLKAFIEYYEINRENIMDTMDIFTEIEAEEKEKVSGLFGVDSLISKYFHEITDGLYEEVLYDQEEGKIEVRRRDGVILQAEKLSGGAYDQLYLSIRLALGEKLLKGKKGFFIMDDPFVKADSDRLKRLIKMLERISDWGWQIIYFSAKDEIKDILKENIDNGEVNYVVVKGIMV